MNNSIDDYNSLRTLPFLVHLPLWPESKLFRVPGIKSPIRLLILVEFWALILVAFSEDQCQEVYRAKLVSVLA